MARAVDLNAFTVNSLNMLPLWCLNSCRALLIAHGFVPQALTDIFVKPVIESDLRDLTDSGNHSPIALASSACKLIKKILYLRLDQDLTTSAKQFGFIKGHSTDQCMH